MSQTITPLIYSGPVRRALRICEVAHRGQTRKSTGTPYMARPVSVALLLAAAGAPEAVIIAGLLHDAVEDTPLAHSQIADRMGHHVAYLVAAVTKAEHGPDGQPLTKDQLNELTVKGLAVAELGAVAVKAADLICNLSDVVLDAAGDPAYLAELYGEKKAAAKIAHYLRLAELLTGRLTDAGAYPLLVDILRDRAVQITALASQFAPAHPGPRPRHIRALPLIYSGRVRAALTLAERTHRGQPRQGTTNTPYILDPISVAALLAFTVADDDLLCAALLEDAVEEGSLDLIAIEDQFGARVAHLVARSPNPTKPPTGAAGVPMRSRGRQTDVTVTQIADLYFDGGDAISQVGKQVGRAKESVRERLIRDGRTVRAPGGGSYPVHLG